LARTFYTNARSALNDAIFLAPNLPPKLDIIAIGSSVTLSWSADITGYQLESALDIHSVIWNPMLVASTNSVTLPATGASRFYRLRKF
jgi:hypothetical protein